MRLQRQANAARMAKARAAEDTPTRAARRANNAARTEEARAAENTPTRAADAARIAIARTLEDSQLATQDHKQMLYGKALEDLEKHPEVSS